MSRRDPGWTGLIELSAPPGYELKHLTDEELEHTIACYCDRCGTELRIHPLFPRVGGRSLEHACVAKPPVVFECALIEIKPMETPTSMLFELDYMYKEQEKK